MSHPPVQYDLPILNLHEFLLVLDALTEYGDRHGDDDAIALTSRIHRTPASYGPTLKGER